jgi:hypothetical protein
MPLHHERIGLNKSINIITLKKIYRRKAQMTVAKTHDLPGWTAELHDLAKSALLRPGSRTAFTVNYLPKRTDNVSICHK